VDCVKKKGAIFILAMGLHLGKIIASSLSHLEINCEEKNRAGKWLRKKPRF